MASLVEPGDVQLEMLTCYLEYALQVLEEETLKQVRTNLTMVKSNRVEYEGLANVYEAGVAKIATLLPMVLQWREDPSIGEPIEEAEPLSWLLLSLAELDRCMQSGGCYMLSCAELLDSDTGNIGVSRMISSLVREFFFSLDLVQVAFSVLMCKHRRHQHDGLERSHEWRDLAVELFFRCRPSEFFEWCEGRCRPVLKQCFLDLGQELWQFSALVGEAAYNDQGHLGHPGNNCKPDPAAELEELTVQPGDTLPLRIDHHDVQDQRYLGQGSYGTVFRCKLHDKDRVVKRIQLDPGNSESERAFESEVSILGSLRHPNAVQTFGFGYTEGRAQGFYVMEQMQTDLSTVIRERRSLSGEPLVFPLDVCMDIISQIVEGACALRRQRVIHRDLKPANILVNRPDESTKPFERFYRVKLADFGTSKVRAAGHSKCSTLRVGTPAYMAPEVMTATLLHEGSGEHGYSWKADVYSFGLVCSEILTGVVPFRKYGGHIGKTLAAVRGGERPDLPLGGGDPLRRLIEDCWKLNPEARPDVWEVRKRLWECKLFHFFTMEKPSASWQTYCFRLGSRANINRSETGAGSSSPISGNKEREQAAVLQNSPRGALQVTELMRNVISMARSDGGCDARCGVLAEGLSSIKKLIEPILKNLMKPQNQRLCLAEVERLRGWKTGFVRWLRDVTPLLRGVGVHHCVRISIATSELLGLFSSEIMSLYVKILEMAAVRQGPVVMPTREQVIAAMDRIQFDPLNAHIAVCGTSGSGVSSFINALRGLKDGDADAARVGVTQCTSEITRYQKEFGNKFQSFSDIILSTGRRSVWFYDVPGAGSMAFPEGQYFNDQGLFVFDAIVLVYGARFSRIDMEIIKTSLQFNVPVFIVRSKADEHIANMIRVEIGMKRRDKYNKIYQEMADKYVQATRSEFQDLMSAMATDPEMDLRDQEVLLKQRVYIVSSKQGSQNIDEDSLSADLWNFFSTSLSQEVLVTLDSILHRLRVLRFR